MSGGHNEEKPRPLCGDTGMLWVMEQESAASIPFPHSSGPPRLPVIPVCISSHYSLGVFAPLPRRNCSRAGSEHLRRTLTGIFMPLGHCGNPAWDRL